MFALWVTASPPQVPTPSLSPNFTQGIYAVELMVLGLLRYELETEKKLEFVKTYLAVIIILRISQPTTL